MLKLFLFITLALSIAYAMQRSVERQRWNYEYDRQWARLFRDIRTNPEYADYTDAQIQRLGESVQTGAFLNFPRRTWKSCILPTLLTISVLTALFAFARSLTQQGYDEGFVAGQAARDSFYADHSNFCAACNVLRYDEENGNELDGHADSIKTEDGTLVPVWVCYRCLEDDDLFICIDGTHYTFAPAKSER